MGIVDWGLGPIPNPHIYIYFSQIIKIYKKYIKYCKYFFNNY